jgi:glutamine amidotransferase
METCAVIDYGMGNLRSVAKALEHVSERTRVVVTADPEEVKVATRVVFPGVGAIRDCMHELRRLGLDEVVRECARTKPFLGVCLGMQALLDYSEENEGTRCLGILHGRVRRFPDPLTDPFTGEKLKVPHMGWNKIQQVSSHPLWNGIPQDSRYYFVHSYYVDPEQRDLTAATTFYGLSFASACNRGNIFAVQFHPEKSQTAGLALLANFLRWDGAS